MSETSCTTCTHALKTHQSADRGKVGPCRVTGCACELYVEPPLEVPPGAPRRVCIDVPPGYVLSVSLIPHTPIDQEES